MARSSSSLAWSIRSSAPSRSSRASPSARPSCPRTERIAFRIGINIGDVIIEGDDIYGDGVERRRASRGSWPSLAKSCVSRTVYNQVQGQGRRSASRPIGEHRVKNIPEPVHGVSGDRRARPARQGGRARSVPTRRIMAPGGARRLRRRAPGCSWPAVPGCGVRSNDVRRRAAPTGFRMYEHARYGGLRGDRASGSCSGRSDSRS